jgi:hypothetical protein
VSLASEGFVSIEFPWAILFFKKIQGNNKAVWFKVQYVYPPAINQGQESD